MPIYIILGRLTNKALETMKTAKERHMQAQKVIKAAGGTFISYYYTIGRYDFIATVEMPSAEILTKLLLDFSRWGTVTTETMTAILPEDLYSP